MTEFKIWSELLTRIIKVIIPVPGSRCPVAGLEPSLLPGRH
jgi:hypothetical protein